MKSYSIKNIKSFRDETTIEIKPITIFVGKNSCGKSSLLRFPVVLSQTFATDTSSPIKFYGKMIDYGNFEDVVFGHTNESISFSLRYDLDISGEIVHRFFYGGRHDKEKDIRSVDVVVSLCKKTKKIVIEQEEIYISGLKCYGIYREDDKSYSFRLYQSYDKKTKTFTEVDRRFVSTHKETASFIIHHETETLVSQLMESFSPNLLSKIDKDTQKDLIRTPELFFFPGVKSEILKKNKNAKNDIDEFEKIFLDYSFYNDLMDVIMRKCRYELNRLSYIGPFRQNPERIYRDEQFRTNKVGVKGENVSTVLYRDYQKKNQLIDRISQWLQDTVGYKLVLDEISNGLFNIVLEDANGIKSNIIDVGYGISQILPIVAQILVDDVKKPAFYVDTDTTDDLIIVEQPELHLHPAAQSELASLFVEGALSGNKKMLIETHSEHFIRKLQVLVADKECKLSNTDVAIYYVEKKTDGVAYINEMKLAPNGKFENKWPEGFFDKAYELSMELLKKSMS